MDDMPEIAGSDGIRARYRVFSDRLILEGAF
jgi:hypothetical protein